MSEITYTITRYSDGSIVAAHLPGTARALDQAGVPIDVQGSLGYGVRTESFLVWADDTHTDTVGLVITRD